MILLIPVNLQGWLTKFDKSVPTEYHYPADMATENVAIQIKESLFKNEKRNIKLDYQTTEGYFTH